MQEPTYDYFQTVKSGRRSFQITKVILDDDLAWPCNPVPVRYYGLEIGPNGSISPIELSLWWLDETIKQ